MGEPDSQNPSFEYLWQFHELLSLRHQHRDPWSLQTAIRGARARTLVLSKFKEVERTYASSVNALDVSLGDGRFLLSGGGDGSVVVHGVTKPSATVEQVFPVLGKVSGKSVHAHEYAVSACQFYPHDPGVFVTSGKDGHVKIWDTHKMTPVHKFTFKLPILDHNMSLVKSAKPLIAVACMDKHAYICDIRTMSQVHTLVGHMGPVTCVRWARHGTHLLATGGADGRVLLWDVRKANSRLGCLDANNNSATAANATAVNFAHDKSVISLEFSEDAAHMVSYGADHRIRLWSTVTGKNTMVNYGRVAFEFRDMTRHLQMSLSSGARPDLIFIPSSDKILIFDMLSGVRVAALTAHFGQTLTCAFHSSRQSLFSGATDRNILLWTPSSDYKEFDEEMEIVKRRQMDRSTKRLADAAISTQLQMDTWSDDEG